MTQTQTQTTIIARNAFIPSRRMRELAQVLNPGTVGIGHDGREYTIEGESIDLPAKELSEAGLSALAGAIRKRVEDNPGLGMEFCNERIDFECEGMDVTADVSLLVEALPGWGDSFRGMREDQGRTEITVTCCRVTGVDEDGEEWELLAGLDEINSCLE